MPWIFRWRRLDLYALMILHIKALKKLGELLG